MRRKTYTPNIKTSLSSIILFSFSLLLSSLFNGCSGGRTEEKLIVTRNAVNSGHINFLTGEAWRYPEKASLIMIYPASASKKPEVLTDDFYSACSPDVSYDGKKILFAGKLNENDHWQIFEMKLSSRKYRRIIPIEDNCTDPLWLPGGRILFSRSIHNDTTGYNHKLFTCLPDGSDLQQITFHPHADFAPSVLADGRVIFITKQVYPSSKNPLCYVMRPDGTKADKYFNSASGGALLCRARENSEGNIFYIESANKNINTGLMHSVHRNRPLFTRITWPDFGGNFRALFFTHSGEMFVSYRPREGKTFGIYRYDISGEQLPELVYSEEESDLIDIVAVEVHPREKKLPSEVDMEVKTGQVMCQDINIAGTDLILEKKSSKKLRRIEILGVGVSLGKVDVEEDGSFYLKLLANMPFRIRAIDENGNELTRTSGWIWMRPNERRGCVGCHEDPELVPDNKVPMAVRKPPVNIPQHIEKIKEKLVELE